jgi:hypothetical protein
LSHSGGRCRYEVVRLDHGAKLPSGFSRLGRSGQNRQGFQTIRVVNYSRRRGSRGTKMNPNANQSPTSPRSRILTSEAHMNISSPSPASARTRPIVATGCISSARWRPRTWSGLALGPDFRRLQAGTCSGQIRTRGSARRYQRGCRGATLPCAGGDEPRAVPSHAEPVDRRAR